MAVADFDARYELVERIGSGGAGEVWLAHDERLGGRPVAIKIMHRHVLPDSGDVDRFEHEMRVAARLDHPNIVTIYTTGTSDDAPFAVMEYLEGQDLDMTLPDGDPQRVAAIGRDICAALAYAHGEGVIHGDIKPGNVVLRDTGQAKVTDFGLARAVGGPASGSTEVGDGMLPYLSPGQWLGEAPAFSDDIWSVGCVLYRLLSGRLPRVLPGAADYIAAARRGDPVPDLRPGSAAPDWLTGAVLAMLDPDPASRATAGDCVRMLSAAAVPGRPPHGRLLAGQADPGSVSATAAVAAPTTAARWRRPGRVLSVSVVALVLLLAGSITAWRFDTASRSSRPTLSRVVTYPPASGAAGVKSPAASWSSSAAAAQSPPASASLSAVPAASSSRSPSASPSGSVSASTPASPAASPPSSPPPPPSSPPPPPPSGTPTGSAPPGGPPPGGPPPGTPPPGAPPPGAPPPPGGPPPPAGAP
jgi:eukaryotic-like serine/threonine-protein kinase